ncbi:hypothetical protein P106B_83 [Rhizobium phage vB_RglS_P106B]|uniref:Transmembrane protein n=1 Tax=Rhizobium phage vB_RglS_P106B TaxID=1458697 RepID=W6EKK1_9CAUD|nr:hypothetical protein P106B_83 [Rhizobium phage vB_RglS_P106B]AHJ10766.1 hypothetical protein P106B_83 [Rhizobium phage vB_RglS_P106B]
MSNKPPRDLSAFQFWFWITVIIALIAIGPILKTIALIKYIGS